MTTNTDLDIALEKLRAAGRTNNRRAADYLCREALEALERLAAAPTPATVTLTALNLRNALDFVAPDFEADEDQREAEVTIAWGPDRTSTEGEPLAAGYYCWLTDYPEEGCIPLDQGEWHPPGTTTEEREAAQATKPTTLAEADEEAALDSYDIDGQSD